jgi:hypothetical protein
MTPRPDHVSICLHLVPGKVGMDGSSLCILTKVWATSEIHVCHYLGLLYIVPIIELIASSTYNQTKHVTAKLHPVRMYERQEYRTGQ